MRWAKKAWYSGVSRGRSRLRTGLSTSGTWMDICFHCLGRKARLDRWRRLLAMKEFAANVWPELMKKILAGIAQQSEADACPDRVHALALAGNIKIGNGARRGNA